MTSVTGDVGCIDISMWLGRGELEHVLMAAAAAAADFVIGGSRPFWGVWCVLWGAAVLLAWHHTFLVLRCNCFHDSVGF